MSKNEQLVGAVKLGDVAQVKLLLAQGADVNSKHEEPEGYSNRTPLIYAAMHGHLEIVKVLLSAGADHKAKDRFIMPSEGGGETALHHAIETRHHEIVRALIAAGASVNAKSGSATTLMSAVRKGDPQMVAVLLESGANPNAHKDGFTALGTAVMDNRKEIARVLLQMGADPDYQDPNFGHTYLIDATQKGQLEIVKALLEAKANVHLRDDCGRTCLMTAAEGGELIQIGEGEYAKYSDDPRLVGSSTLRTEKNAKEIIELLLAAGADVNARTPSGWSAIMFASDAPPDRTAIIKLLRQAGAVDENLDWIPVLQAIADEKPWQRVSILFSKIRNPNVRSWSGYPMVHAMRSSADKVAAIRAMVEKGADPNLGATDTDSGDCFLKYAIYAEDESLIRWLIKRGANPNLTAKNGKNILADTYRLEDFAAAIQEEMRERFEAMPVKEPAPPDFSKVSNAPAFQAVVGKFTKQLKASPKQLFPEREGAFVFATKSCEADEILLEGHDELRSRGAYALATNTDHTQLALLPTNSWAEALAFIQTSAQNVNLTNAEIIQKLRELELDVPFIIIGAGHDFAEGRFLKALHNSRKVAQFLYELCPDMVDQGAGTVANAAVVLKKTRRFLLWWD